MCRIDSYPTVKPHKEVQEAQMTKMVTPSFNLIDEPWIKAISSSGKLLTLSIRQIFEQATEINKITGDISTQNFTIFRLLQAILWRSYALDIAKTSSNLSQFDYTDWWFDNLDNPELDLQTINSYLDHFHDRFWLIHPQQPFYQVADLETTKNEVLSIQRLLSDSESGYFAMKAGVSLDALPHPEAARWLLHAQAYDYSGIKPAAVGDARAKNGKGYPIGTGSVGVGAGIIIHGKNLQQTMILNLPANKISESVKSIINKDEFQDLPAWELPAQTSSSRHDDALLPRGPLDALTWQSRRVRLHSTDNHITGVVVTNGDKLELKNNSTDPFMARQYSKNLSKSGLPIYLPKKIYSDRTFWKGLEGLLYRHSAMQETKKTVNPQEPSANIKFITSLSKSDLQIPVNVELIGAEYGPQDSVITNIINTEIPMNLMLLTQDCNEWADVIVQNISKILEASSAIGRFSGMLTEASGGTYSYDADISSETLFIFENHFRKWLNGLPLEHDPLESIRKWWKTARNIALKIADERMVLAGPSAFIGRISNSTKSDTTKDSKPKIKSAGAARLLLQKEINSIYPLKELGIEA